MRDENPKSEEYPGSHGMKGEIFRRHETINIIQDHEINVKMELSGSLCVKLHY